MQDAAKDSKQNNQPAKKTSSEVDFAWTEDDVKACGGIYNYRAKACTAQSVRMPKKAEFDETGSKSVRRDRAQTHLLSAEHARSVSMMGGQLKLRFGDQKGPDVRLDEGWVAKFACIDWLNFEEVWTYFSLQFPSLTCSLLSELGESHQPAGPNGAARRICT